MIAHRFSGSTVFTLLMSAALAAACGGCPGNKAADANTDFKPVAIDAPVNAATEMPAVPKDAQYTLVCRVFSDDTHVQLARQAQQQLHDATSLKKWYVVHSNDHSTLYYGFYRCIDPRDARDGAEGQRALNDQNTIRAMADSNGQRLFSECLLVPIDSPDPQANPAWDIARSRGTWSIEIASYTVADRKQLAVDSVREMRAHGIEAYYYHGETASSVCIGSWPAEAAVEVSFDQLNSDPDKPVVVTNQPLTQEYVNALSNAGASNVVPHVEIMDPTLTAALSKWKAHAVNGEEREVVDPVTQEKKPAQKSFMFKIPHKDALDSVTPDMAAVPQNYRNNRKPDGTPGDGQLRTLGE